MRIGEIVPAPVSLDEMGEWNHPALPCFLSDMEHDEINEIFSDACLTVYVITANQPFIDYLGWFLVCCENCGDFFALYYAKDVTVTLH